MLIKATYVGMVEKIGKYKKRMKGNNVFTIIGLINLHLKLNLITLIDHDMILSDIHRLFRNVVEEGCNYQHIPNDVTQVTSQ